MELYEILEMLDLLEFEVCDLDMTQEDIESAGELIDQLRGLLPANTHTGDDDGHCYDLHTDCDFDDQHAVER